MVTIDTLICQSINSFDQNLKAGNFWLEQQEAAQTVDSIHLEELKKIESYLDLVAQDHFSRTLLLLGDSGSGKSYLLGRLKRQLNNKAFFVYIDPWVDSRFIWRHILRKTINSFLYKPQNQSESQLLLWLKSLPIIKEDKLLQNFSNVEQRQRFITYLKNTYPDGLNNAREFLGVLYDLMNPSLSDLASDWLKGDHLAEEDLKELRVSSSINNEDYARGILENLGKISIESRPIIFCFDQLDNIPLSPSGFIDLQSLFNVNSNIHTQVVSNFLIIISMPTSTWKDNEKRIQPSDLAAGRLHQKIILKTIDKKQIEAIWSLKVSSLHTQINPKPNSSIYPLNQQQIEINFPSGKTLPRTALVVGRNLYQAYKDGLLLNHKVELNKTIKNNESTGKTEIIEPPKDNFLSLFKLYWSEEFQKNKKEIQKVNLFSPLDMVKMLGETLQALKVQKIQIKILNSKFNDCSLSYIDNEQRIGIIWTEDQNLTNFCHIMNACVKAINNKTCQRIYLLRNATVGNPNNKGYQTYRSIFHHSLHRHLQPTLTSIHYLKTYHQLVMDAKSKDLVIAGKEIDLSMLEDLIRQSRIFESCQLLLDLGLIQKKVEESLEKRQNNQEEYNKIKEYLLSIIKTQNFISIKILIEKTLEHFSDNFLLNFDQVHQLIKDICEQNLAIITNPEESPEKQLICLKIQSK
jgi:hypothetical protein